MTTTQTVEQWGVYEDVLQGPAEGNPFLDVEIAMTFTHKHRSVEVDGFYDGDGVYRVRFMPDIQGTWRYRTSSNRAELNGHGRHVYLCRARSRQNHGPVRVANTYHFAYADGTPYKQIGTTCYVWTHQGDELEEQTLATLADAPFNKMRMCVFPKHYAFNENEPSTLSVSLSCARPEHVERQLQGRCAARAGEFDFDALRAGLFPALRTARRRSAGAGHRGRYYPAPPLRPLGLRHDGRRDRRPLPALYRGAPRRLP